MDFDFENLARDWFPDPKPARKAPQGGILPSEGTSGGGSGLGRFFSGLSGPSALSAYDENVARQQALAKAQREKMAAKAKSLNNENLTAKALEAKGVSKEDIAVAIANPAVMQSLLKTHFSPKEKAKPIEINGKLVDPETYQVLGDYSTPKGEATDTPEARARVAQQYGLDPNSDAGRAYILTGKMPREDQQALTATDKKAILEADEMVSVNRGAINALDEANRLSPQAYDGVLASQRAWLANNLWPGATPEAEATSNLDNAVVGNALSQLKAIFGAAPTEGERKILLELQGSANQPAAVREAIYARARAAAVKRLQFNEDRARQLRGGTYYKPQSAAGPQPAPSGVGGAPIRAKNPGTGETIEWNGSEWVPAQ